MPVEVSDVVQLGFIALGVPFGLIAVLSAILHFFVALKSPPSRRAAWVCGIAYVLVTMLVMWPVPYEYQLWVPLAGLPAALVAFWFWRREFQKAWIDDPELLPAGATLEDDDWKTGLLRLSLFVVLMVGFALARFILDGMAFSLSR